MPRWCTQIDQKHEQNEQKIQLSPLLKQSDLWIFLNHSQPQDSSPKFVTNGKIN